MCHYSRSYRTRCIIQWPEKALQEKSIKYSKLTLICSSLWKQVFSLFLSFKKIRRTSALNWSRIRMGIKKVPKQMLHFFSLSNQNRHNLFFSSSWFSIKLFFTNVLLSKFFYKVIRKQWKNYSSRCVEEKGKTLLTQKLKIFISQVD